MKAKNYFEKALPLIIYREAKSEVYYNLGELAINHENDLAKAFGYAEKAIETDPSNELGYILYGKATVLSSDDKNIEKAIEYLLKALFLNPNRALTDYWQGQLFFKLGDYKNAMFHYDIALEEISNDITLSETAKKDLKSDIYMAKLGVNIFKKDLEEAKINMFKAFEFNPVKTIFMIQNTEELKLLEPFLSN